MKITVVNSGTAHVPLPGYTSVEPGGSKTLTGRDKSEYLALVSQFAGSDVRVFGEIEDEDLPPINAEMANPGDGTSGADTVAGVGFSFKNAIDGQDVASVQKMYLGVFDDADGKVPATNATLDTASKGSILSGAGTHIIEVRTDSNGEFACTVTDSEDETVYIRCWPHAETSRMVDCSGSDSVTFSA